MAEVHALVVAAGRGTRFGSEAPKQYSSIAGRTVLEHAVQPFLDHPEILDVTVVLADDDERFGALSLAHSERLHTASGGAQRARSVLNGLRTLQGRGASEDALVLVHDGARPCVTRAEIDALLALGEGMLALPVSDTLKSWSEIAGQVLIDTTLAREGVLRALTPQCFRLERLCDALSGALAAGRVPSDEAQAIEWTGARVAVAWGAATNIKVTTPGDLLLAAAVLAARDIG